MDTHQAVSSSPLTGLSWISQVLSMTARVASPGNNEVPCPRALRLLQAIAATAVGGLLLCVATSGRVLPPASGKPAITSRG